MSTTILEALQNADYNLQNNNVIGVHIAKEQLHNSVELLLKDYELSDEVDPLLEKWGDVANVPDKP